MEKKNLRELGNYYSQHFCVVRKKLKDAIQKHIEQYGPIVDVDVETTIYTNGYIVIDVEKVYIDDEGWLVVKDKDGYEFTFNSWTHDTLLDICCSLV